MLRRFCDKVKLSSDYFSFSGLEKNARDHKRAAKIQTGLNSSQDLATTSRGVLKQSQLPLRPLSQHYVQRSTWGGLKELTS